MARRRNRTNTNNYTGVLRRGQNRPSEERTSQIEEVKGFRWRIVSALMILL